MFLRGVDKIHDEFVYHGPEKLPVGPEMILSDSATELKVASCFRSEVDVTDSGLQSSASLTNFLKLSTPLNGNLAFPGRANNRSLLISSFALNFNKILMLFCICSVKNGQALFCPSFQQFPHADV